MGKYDAMTVNERLFEAGLLDAYDVAVRSGDLNEIHAVLKQVDLRQDETGMNWSIDADD
ncbi:hypothetical protein ACUXST_001346 [Sphingomonas sp. F9_3S_D5_B_2]